jgi:hypothetical protein
MKKFEFLGVVALVSTVPFAVDGQSINVQLSRTTSASTIVTTENAPITIAGNTADTADSGTFWNSLICPTVATANTSGSQLTYTVEQNLSLVDSSDNASSVSISSIQFSENNNKTDTIHNTGMVAGTNPGTDGLSANPSSLVGQSWFNNGTSEFMIFNLTGLTPGNLYNLYIYGAGQNVGFGGTYTVPVANQAAGYNAAANAYSTEPSATSIYRSVVDSGGNPLTEQGLTWAELPVQADSSGDLSFDVLKDGLSGIKGSINGFQLQPEPTPEPSTMALFGGGLSLAAAAFRRGRARS